MTTKIIEIVLGHKTDYITFDDMNDMIRPQKFNMIVNKNKTIENIKEFGADIIKVDSSFNESDDSAKYLNRIAKIAKATGYKNNVTLKDMYQENDNIRHEWKEISGTFTKEVI